MKRQIKDYLNYYIDEMEMFISLNTLIKINKLQRLS